MVDLINLDNSVIFSQKIVIHCQKLQKVVNSSQKKMIHKLVFLGRFNAFLKEKIQKDGQFLSKTGLFFVFSVQLNDFLSFLRNV